MAIADYLRYLPSTYSYGVDVPDEEEDPILRAERGNNIPTPPSTSPSTSQDPYSDFIKETYIPQSRPPQPGLGRRLGAMALAGWAGYNRGTPGATPDAEVQRQKQAVLYGGYPEQQTVLDRQLGAMKEWAEEDRRKKNDLAQAEYWREIADIRRQTADNTRVAAEERASQARANSLARIAADTDKSNAQRMQRATQGIIPASQIPTSTIPAISPPPDLPSVVQQDISGRSMTTRDPSWTTFSQTSLKPKLGAGGEQVGFEQREEELAVNPYDVARQKAQGGNVLPGEEGVDARAAKIDFGRWKVETDNDTRLIAARIRETYNNAIIKIRQIEEKGRNARQLNKPYDPVKDMATEEMGVRGIRSQFIQLIKNEDNKILKTRADLQMKEEMKEATIAGLDAKKRELESVLEEKETEFREAMARARSQRTNIPTIPGPGSSGDTVRVRSKEGTVVEILRSNLPIAIGRGAVEVK